MKKTALFVIGATVFASAANAGFVPSTAPVTATNGDNMVVTDTIITVKQAKDMKDDTDVVLQGKIVSQFGGERYTFADDTDSIMVEIDDDAWKGQTITPEDTVRIYGEVDRGIFSTEVEVDRVQKM
ncbi:NirD/YgiW/YdeI family stress tolerance protein [bacterium]|nr:NirD/YgiW/YdeI family stress tolerance protein [bacterium]